MYGLWNYSFGTVFLGGVGIAKYERFFLGGVFCVLVEEDGKNT